MKRNSRVFKIAHLIKNDCSSWSEALYKAWKAQKLKEQMKESVVPFKFIRQSDGSVRGAVGTMHNVEHHMSGGPSRPKHLLVFWDINAKSFKSCKIANLILS